MAYQQSLRNSFLDEMFAVQKFRNESFVLGVGYPVFRHDLWERCKSWKQRRMQAHYLLNRRHKDREIRAQLVDKCA